MLHQNLLQFIINYFLEAHLFNVAIFHCWNVETLNMFSTMATQNYISSQYIAMKPSLAALDLEYNFFQYKNPVLGIYLDMNCDSSELILNMSSEQRLYSDHNHWLIYDEKANITNFHRFFVNANLSINADVTYAITTPNRENTDNTSYTLYDVYNNGWHIGGKLNMTLDREISCDLKSCQFLQYLSKLYLRPKYGNRNCLSDITMRVANAITRYPIDRPDAELQHYLLSINNTHIDAVPRFGFHLILLLKDQLKFNVSFSYFNSWSTSELYGGSVGELTQETADMVGTPFFVTPLRLQHFSVLADTGEFRSICMFRTPRNSGIQGSVFLAPFTGTVWLIFGLILLVSAIFLWGIFRVEHTRLCGCLEFVPSMLSTFLVSFGMACYQGSYLIPSSMSGRLAFSTLSLISFIMYNYYTSIVVSSLLGSPVKSKIQTLTQLADSSLEVGLEPVVYTMVYLNTSQLPQVRHFVKRKMENKNPKQLWMPIDEGVQRVRDQPGFVFVFEAATGYAIVEKYYKPHEICDLNEIKLRAEQTIHIQVHRNSTYKELIRLNVLRLMETGVYHKHRHYWLRTHLNCFANNFVIDVGMEYAAPLFCMLISAYFLVVIILIFEIAYKRHTLKREMRMQTLSAD